MLMLLGPGRGGGTGPPPHPPPDPGRLKPAQGRLGRWMDSHVQGGFCPGCEEPPLQGALCWAFVLNARPFSVGAPWEVHPRVFPQASWSLTLQSRPPRSLITQPIWQQLPVTQRRSRPWMPLIHIRARPTAEVLPLEKAPSLCPGPPRVGCPLVDSPSRPGRPICQPGSASVLLQWVVEKTPGGHAAKV